MIAAPYLSERAREVIADRGVGYADTTGNVRVLLDRPGDVRDDNGRRPRPLAETISRSSRFGVALRDDRFEPSSTSDHRSGFENSPHVLTCHLQRLHA